MPQKKFLNPPKTCDICPECFNAVGIGLGTGLGQYYKKDKEGNYIKQ